MGMDEDTGIDVGDFLAFYTGSMESCKVTSVAEITKVSFPKGNDLEQAQALRINGTDPNADAEVFGNMDEDRLVKLGTVNVPVMTLLRPWKSVPLWDICFLT